jgi:hypothetical protein
MLDLNRLDVSLTKHGAHKIAHLIMKYPIEDLLQHLDDADLGIHIDEAQTRKNLSISKNGSIPTYWKEIKRKGKHHIGMCILFAIVFSHHRLIKTMQLSKSRYGTGIVRRGEILDGKEYTNLACIFRELGFSNNQNHMSFEYDFSKVFVDGELAKHILMIIRNKLILAGLEDTDDLIDICLKNKFNLVFGLNQQEFEAWTEKGELIPSLEDEDLNADLGEEDEIPKFTFIPGHLTRQTDDIKLHRRKRVIHVQQLHNKIQNELFNVLSRKYGETNVGTEQGMGMSGKIDVVLNDEGYTFFEIKTDLSLRSCIRQALTQLIEYAYWPDEERSNRLVIVTPNRLTKNAKLFINNLRTKFGIPIYYQSYDAKENEFSEPYPDFLKGA